MKNGVIRAGVTAGVCLGIGLLAGCRHAHYSGEVVVGGPVYEEPAPPQEEVVDVGPPAPPPEVVTVQPAPDYVWAGGFYVFVGGQYRWHNGGWVRPEHPGQRFIPDHYDRRADGRYVHVRGGWR